jgi:hypothetical protein
MFLQLVILQLETMTICWAHTTQNEDKQDRRTQHITINVPTVNFSFICSNISAVSEYGVYISQLIRHCRDCCSYPLFIP